MQIDLFNQNLVQEIKGELLVSSLIVAENVGYEHSSVIRLIRDNLSDFNEFGTLGFEIQKSGGRPTEYALLNENQSTLLITYMRNNEEVKRFKINLIKAFSIMKSKLQEIESKNKPVELSRKDLALMVIRAEEEKEAFAIENQNLKSTIIEKDKVIIAVADLNIKAGEVSIGDFSKNIAIENLGRNNLFAWLKARNFLMMNTEPYQQYVTRGYFVRKPSNKRVNGEVKYTTMLTPKGTIWLTKMLNAEFDLNIEVNNG